MFLAHPNYDHDKKKISDLAPFSRPLFPHGHLTGIFSFDLYEFAFNVLQIDQKTMFTAQ